MERSSPQSAWRCRPPKTVQPLARQRVITARTGRRCSEPSTPPRLSATSVSEPNDVRHLDRRAVRGRRRRDPRRDRRPHPIHHRPRAGQTRLPGPTRTVLGHLHRPHQTHRSRPTQPALGGLARRLGRTTCQPRLRGPLPAPDHSGDQHAHRAAGPGRDHRGHPASPARGDHLRATLGPADRDPRHQFIRTTFPRRPVTLWRPSSRRSGRAPRGIETHHDLASHHGQPRPSSYQPDYTLLGPIPLPLCGDRRRTRQRPSA